MYQVDITSVVMDTLSLYIIFLPKKKKKEKKSRKRRQVKFARHSRFSLPKCFLNRCCYPKSTELASEKLKSVKPAKFNTKALEGPSPPSLLISTLNLCKVT